MEWEGVGDRRRRQTERGSNCLYLPRKDFTYYRRSRERWKMSGIASALGAAASGHTDHKSRYTAAPSIHDCSGRPGPEIASTRPEKISHTIGGHKPDRRENMPTPNTLRR